MIGYRVGRDLIQNARASFFSDKKIVVRIRRYPIMQDETIE